MCVCVCSRRAAAAAAAAARWHPSHPQPHPIPPQEDLADTYVYYATLGMSAPSPHLRAAGVSILAVLVHVAPVLVIPLLPRLLLLRGTLILIDLRAPQWWLLGMKY